MRGHTHTRGELPNSDESWDAHWRTDGAAELDERGISSLMDRVKVSYLEPWLPSRGLFVEFGCGSARVSRFASSRGLESIGLDRSAEALAIARRGAARARLEPVLRFVRGDVVATPLASETVDVVASTGLLEHFTDPSPVVREMVRVLKPGGVFYSDIVPAKFSLYRCLDRFRVHQTDIYERHFSRREIEDLLARAGLQEIEVFGAGVFPPRLPLLGRFAAVRKAIAAAVETTLLLWRAFDRTWVGTVAGFYFFAAARKPE